jgi:hypothetical protein
MRIAASFLCSSPVERSRGFDHVLRFLARGGAMSGEGRWLKPDGRDWGANPHGPDLPFVRSFLVAGTVHSRRPLFQSEFVMKSGKHCYEVSVRLLARPRWQSYWATSLFAAADYTAAIALKRTS